MGENVAELIIDIGSSLRQGKDKVEEDEKLVFFDVLGLFMVSSKISLNNQIGAQWTVHWFRHTVVDCSRIDLC